jgi:RNA polymerase sigma-70 factor (ECF subfamily)
MEKVHVRLSPAKFSTKDSPPKRFARIYARDRPFVRSVLLRFGVPRRDVEDLVQDVFVVVWRRLEGIVADGEIRPWLYTVASNLAKNYRRLARHQREWCVGEMPEVAMISFDPDWIIDAYRRLQRLMRRVDASAREVVVRIAVAGQSVNDVAAELCVSAKTVHSRMRVVRERLGRQGDY